MIVENLEAAALTIVTPPSSFLADERVFPTLAPLYLTSVLEKAGIPVKILDLTGVKNYAEVLAWHLQTSESRQVAFTATTPQIPAVYNLAKITREYGRKIIVGGSHATMTYTAYQEDLKHQQAGRGTKAFLQLQEMADVIVAGDGEKAIFAALKDDAPKLIDASERKSPYFLQRGTLQYLPYPARHHIDLDSYHYYIDGQKATSMITQLGCPFGCGFCGGRHSDSFRLTRNRPVEHIMGEVDQIVKGYGFKGIMFYDDELNISHNGLMGFLEALIKYQEREQINLRLRGFVRADLFTLEQAQAMHRAGFRDLLSGVESGDIGILEAMSKRTTPEINAKWVENCHKAGLRAKALMSIGHPGETEQTIQNSREWILSVKPDDIDWTVITQFPGSPYFDDSFPHPALPEVWVYQEPKTGKVLYSQEVNYTTQAEYYKGLPGDYTAFVWTDELSPKKLVHLRDYTEKVTRSALGLPLIQAVEARQFEHSMGQLPPYILRHTKSSVP